MRWYFDPRSCGLSLESITNTAFLVSYSPAVRTKEAVQRSPAKCRSHKAATRAKIRPNANLKDQPGAGVAHWGTNPEVVKPF